MADIRATVHSRFPQYQHRLLLTTNLEQVLRLLTQFTAITTLIIENLTTAMQILMIPIIRIPVENIPATKILTTRILATMKMRPNIRNITATSTLTIPAAKTPSTLAT